MREYFKSIMLALLTCIGLVLVLSEQMGNDFDLIKFLIVKGMGLVFLAVVVKFGKMDTNE